MLSSVSAPTLPPIPTRGNPVLSSLAGPGYGSPGVVLAWLPWTAAPDRRREWLSWAWVKPGLSLPGSGRQREVATLSFPGNPCWRAPPDAAGLDDSYCAGSRDGQHWGSAGWGLLGHPWFLSKSPLLPLLQPSGSVVLIPTAT